MATWHVFRNPADCLQSYCGKAEKEQLLRSVTNAVHEAYLDKLGIFPTRCVNELSRK